MLIVVLGLLGVCLGSFVNALVYRLHVQEASHSKKASKQLSIINGRSICPHCRHLLAARDLIPVLSWLELRGKCRYCHKPIGWQYPLVELATAILFIGSYLFWPSGFVGVEALDVLQFGLWLAAIVLFMALLVYDLRWMILPNKLVYILIGVALVHMFVLVIAQKDPTILLMSFWAVVSSAGFFYVLFQVSAGKWIGGGDVKLAIALGLLAGSPLQSALLLFIASLAGSLVAIPLLAAGKTKRTAHIPFGPFLIVATIMVYLFGSMISGWYERLILGV